ncbi:unnamed protein product [Tilletia caries]|nr:unnamed protein product [Tilletia caries]
MHSSIIGEIRAMRDELASRLDGFNERLGEVEKIQRGTAEDEEEDISGNLERAANTSTQLLEPMGPADYPPTTPAFVTRRPPRILPHQATRSTEPQSSPIQAHALRSQLFTTPSPSGSTPLDRFKAMTTPERRKIRLAMKKLGIQVQEFMGAADDSGSVTSQDAHDGNLAVDGEDTSNESPLRHVVQPDTPPGPAIAPAPNIRPGQPLTCKQEFLGKYSGDPTRLEAFLSRVRDVIRSDNSAAWTAAVMHFHGDWPSALHVQSDHYASR